MSPKESIANLTTLLNRANYDYYVDASPTLSDHEYDQLLLELAQLEVEHPGLVNKNSPTQRVGGEPIDAFHSVQHNVPMQSIDNTYTLEDIELWHSKLPSGSICICDPKIDGVAISLRYKRGTLVSAVTRGDGESGDDVTVQAKTIRSIPLTLRGDPPEILEVRGEIFMPNTSFEEINLQRKTEGVQLFANARNATAGTLKSLDPKKVSKRKLAFLAHGKGEVEWEGMPSSWSEFVQGLRDLGIPSSGKAIICNTPSEITNAVVAFGDVKDSLGYGVDGMVVRVNDFASQVELGATSKSPRWCIAYKYPAEQGVTKLLSVDWQVGKNGTLTPRATMEPIQLAGTTVQHATLHNIDEIHRKDIRIFDSVVVEKAGEIIPQVIGFKEDARDGSQIIIEPPKGCPTCDGPVEKEGPKLYCVSPECPAQFREKVKWFAARDQMNIDGLGDKVVDQLVDAGLVQHFADLYRLQSADLLPLEGFAEKSAEGLVAAIEESKTRGLARVLSGVGIRLVGRATAKTIARNFPDLDSLQQATLEEFVALDDFGKITAETLYKAIHCEKGQTLFRRLQDAGVLLESTKSQNIDPAFDGKIFVITGTFEHWERKKLTDELEKRGAKVSGSVSKNTSIVLAGEKAGSKLKKAVSLGVEVWDEAQLTASLSG